MRAIKRPDNYFEYLHAIYFIDSEHFLVFNCILNANALRFSGIFSKTIIDKKFILKWSYAYF